MSYSEMLPARPANHLKAAKIRPDFETMRRLPAHFGAKKASAGECVGKDGMIGFYLKQKNVAFALSGHKITHLGV